MFTNTNEMKLHFRDYFTFIGSMVWAMLIIVIGCVLYAQDIFVNGHKRKSHRTQVCKMRNVFPIKKELIVI